MENMRYAGPKVTDMDLALSERLHAERGCRFRRIAGPGFRLAFEITRRCNLRCRHCFVKQDQSHPSTGEILRLIRQAGDLHCRKLIVTGGEPLLRDDLEQFIAAAVEAGMLVDLNSNLFALTPERAAALREHGLQEASVSLYGGRHMHDELTQKQGAFDRALKGISWLREVGITVDVHGAIWDAMLPGMENLVMTVKKHGVHSISFFSLLPTGFWSRGEKYTLNPEKALIRVEQVRARVNIPIRTIGLRSPDRDECVMANGILGISADLQLKPCLLSLGQDRGVDLHEKDLSTALEKVKKQVSQRMWQMACCPPGSGGPDKVDSDRFTETFLGTLPDVNVPHPLECLNISVSTRCSLGCRICAYPYSRIPRQIMSDALFQSLIDRAIRFGYRTFNLTPLLGEVLLDPSFSEKLQYLDHHPGVKFYFFSSNFTHADNAFFEVLEKLKKLRWLSVSFYGLNPQDYSLMTRASEAVFKDVVKNLNKLLSIPSLAGRCEVKVRGPGPQVATPPLTECVELMTRLQDQDILVRHGVRIMNWGGVIKQETKGLFADFKEVERRRKTPCVFLFHKPTILPDGTVNACSCGDAHALLRIGRFAEQEFDEVFSVTNSAYMHILRQQLVGIFSGPCSGCSGYRALDRPWYSYRYHDRDFIPLRTFFKWLVDHECEATS
jgi:MoaA/NifB/PqqE/SkfB family radical SAM enzyme